MVSDIQAALFSKEHYTEDEAKREFEHMGLHLLPHKKIHGTANYWRFRVHRPEDYKKMRIKHIPKRGISLIIGIK